MKSKKILRWMGLLLSLSLLFSLAALPAAALTPAYQITGAYLKSTYHKNLTALPRTRDKAFDTVAVAMTQIGYHEGNGSADLGGQNSSGYKNYTEYNRSLGTVDGTYGYAWCAAFVSWCLTQADAADAAGGQFVSCSLWLEKLKSIGQYSTRASGYQPSAGDLIFFRSSGAGRASDHVGIVRYISGGRVYTVEGNSSDKVSLNSYALTNTYIVGYGKPKYGEKRIPSPAFSYEDQAPGWYIVTHDFVNVRTGASTSFSKSGTLKHGDMVCMTKIQNGWGAFEENGKTRYISLEYADFVSPVTHRVKYDASGGEGAPATASYFSFEPRAVSETVPTREGYTFLGWQDAAGTAYQPGDKLSVATVTLTAIWEAIPVVEPPAEPLPEETPPADSEADAPAADDPTPEMQPEQGGTEDYLSPGGRDPAIETLPDGTDAVGNDMPFAAPDVAVSVLLGLSALGLGWYIWRKKRKT